MKRQFKENIFFAASECVKPKAEQYSADNTNASIAMRLKNHI